MAKRDIPRRRHWRPERHRLRTPAPRAAPQRLEPHRPGGGARHVCNNQGSPWRLVSLHRRVSHRDVALRRHRAPEGQLPACSGPLVPPDAHKLHRLGSRQYRHRRCAQAAKVVDGRDRRRRRRRGSARGGSCGGSSHGCGGRLQGCSNVNQSVPSRRLQAGGRPEGACRVVDAPQGACGAGVAGAAHPRRRRS